ncbi:2,3-diketo-L-gulonate TRAP transporter small permease protein YiaM [Planctomycetes bacterium CA13]|uniref:2,3-diketo-L-gulonate TRAP transporter small permease protein YiaM n=1 Tax=Novipirellula herctigrandis TaxID=2527986 RepID=A0A5C5YWZ3_9BACT|nr:2,3-diketo-L-gulonate TRAP transporter small permease protein YiaM [Planctomycetes bacterium CA13]
MESDNANQRTRFLAILTRLLELTLILAMGFLVIDVLWGVFSRMLASWGMLARQSSWTEELARYLMIWVGLLGASLAFESRSHLGVDYFVGKFHPAGRKILKLGALLVVLLFAIGVLLIGGWQLVSRTLALKQDTPALGIPKGWVYLAVPISGVFTSLFTLGHMWDVLCDRDELPQPREEGMD